MTAMTCRQGSTRRLKPRGIAMNQQSEAGSATTRADAPGDLLYRAVETEFIPRLMLSVRCARPAGEASRSERIRAEPHTCIAGLVATLLEGSEEAAQRLLDIHVAEGASSEVLLLELMAPAARRLGELWVEDLCTFLEVTIAMGMMQSLLRRLVSDSEYQMDDDNRRILLLPTSGEQHTFALQVLDAFFSRAGWLVDRSPKFVPIEVKDCLRRLEPDVIGLTLSTDVLLEQLASDIDMIRRASGRRVLSIIVGGPVFAGRPDRVTLVGADGAADDAPGAVALAGRLAPIRLAH